VVLATVNGEKVNLVAGVTAAHRGGAAGELRRPAGGRARRWPSRYGPGRRQ
jgi:hypothetical protein